MRDYLKCRSMMLFLAFLPSLLFVSCGSDTDLDESDLVGSWRIAQDQDGKVDRTKNDVFYKFNADHSFREYFISWGKKNHGTGTWELKRHNEVTLLILVEQGINNPFRARRNGDTLTLDKESEPDYAGVFWVYERSQEEPPEPQSSTRFQSRGSRTTGEMDLMSNLLPYFNVGFGVLLLLLIVRWFFIRDKNLTILSRWHHLYGNLNESSKEFYTSVETAIKSRNVPDVQLSRVDHNEGGLFSAKREYLRVRRKEHIFDICAAPFGNAFFFSWWLGEKPSVLWNLVLLIPVLGPWLFSKLRPVTYYRLDTAAMFQGSIHSAVMEALDAVIKTKGLRSLSEQERKPVMTELFRR